MRFVTIRQMRQNSAKLWKQLKESQEIILTSNGKPVAVMAGVDEENLERTLKAFRRAKAAIALDEMHRASSKSGTSLMSDDDIEAEIQAVRRDRTA
ncbi:type II toxin-antitoxin system Phd/YefM family antitoxin [bacterium]|nr:type II toxin-antitoxin system Phd/YefM family antitoxin [bacterium]